MKRYLRPALMLSVVGGVLSAHEAHGQRGAIGNWAGSGNDAAHSGWQKGETILTRDDVPTQFKFLWKIKLGSQTKEAATFSEPLLAPRLINGQGFKDFVYWGSTDTLYAVDSELGVLLWQKHFDAQTKVSGKCGQSSLGIAIEPPQVINFGARRAPGAALSTPPPPPTSGPRRLGGPARGGGFAFRGIYVLRADGYLSEQVLTTGADYGPPVKFLPEAKGGLHGLSMVGKTVYTVTDHGCGAARNALWSIEVGSGSYPIASYDSKTVAPLDWMGPTVAGGVAYLVTEKGAADDAAGVHANSVVALTADDMKVKDWYTPSVEKHAALPNITPVAFNYKDKKLVAAAGTNGSFVLLDSASLGGSDHHTPLVQTAAIAKRLKDLTGGLASWQGTDGTVWVLAPIAGPLDAGATAGAANGAAPHGSIVAFKVEEKDGKTAMTPAWVSGDLVHPAPPVVANGLVIALAQGDAKTHATLHVLDALTGKELYTSGEAINGYAHLAGVAVGDGHAFFTTHDGTLYSFGIGMEH